MRRSPRVLRLAVSFALIMGACRSDPDADGAGSAGGPVVVAVGDIACPGEPCAGQRATAALVERIDPVAVLALGDLQYVEGSLEDFLSSYEPTWGRFADRTRPVPGNHEYREDGARGYFDYFGASAHEEQGGWYSFEVGDWHLVAINSGTGTISEEQLAWVRQDLAGDDHRCELAYWHHPRFTSGTVHGPDPEPALDTLWRVLHTSGVDVVLNGHEHNYERFSLLDPDGTTDPSGGIRQFVVGTGGRSHYPFGAPLRGSEKRITDAFGVLRMVLGKDGYGWSFVDVEGNVLDDGSADCHA